MDTAELILEYLKALMWPAVALLAILLFKRELRELFGSVQRLRLPGGTELDWQKKLAEVEAAADKVESVTSVIDPSWNTKDRFQEQVKKTDQKGLQRSATDFDFSYYAQIAESDPNLSLAGLRMELERMLQNLAVANNIDINQHRTSPGRFSGMLRRMGILPEDQYHLLRTIIVVANGALHGRDVSKEDALRTIESAELFKQFYLSWLEKL